MEILIDTHFHFDFINDVEVRANLLRNQSIEYIAQTVVPSEFLKRIEPMPQKISLGFHPWWIKSESQIDQELSIFLEAIHQTRYIGEIGLDFSPKRLKIANQELQINVFSHILEVVKRQSVPCVLSIHAVRASEIIIDLLEEKQIYQHHIAIIHYFSGTSDELMRHIRLGGYISVNPKMLTSKKGRAYVKQVPSERILLETDLPEHKDAIISPQEVNCLLEQMIEQLSEICGEEMRSQIIKNQERVYGRYQEFN